MSASYPIRPVTASELPAFAEVGHDAFNSGWPPDGLLALDRLVFEPERSLAAFDGDQVIGTAIAYSFGLTVPGGKLPAAGVSSVAVRPSYRRRGILTSLMARQLTDVIARGEPVAILFASDAAIYRRFGYGQATASLSFQVSGREARLSPEAAGHGSLADPPGTAVPAMAGPAGPAGTAPVTLRSAEPAKAAADMARVYDAIAAVRPGMITRTRSWWDLTISDPDFMRDGMTPLRCVVADGADGPLGYALYAVKGGWDSDGVPSGALTVHELFAADAAAYAALWADLLSRDLVAKVSARRRPADDPLPQLLTDPRQVRARISDGLWVRLADVPDALTRRRYACAVDLVIEVTDRLVPANSGRWRLRAAGAGKPATCEPATAPADVRLDVSVLGAAYLGESRLSGPAAAGLAAETRPGALAALSAAMWWEPAPWSPIMF